MTYDGAGGQGEAKLRENFPLKDLTGIPQCVIVVTEITKTER